MTRYILEFPFPFLFLSHVEWSIDSLKSQSCIPCKVAVQSTIIVCVINISLYYPLPNALELFSLECNTLFVNCTLLGQRPRRILNQFESRLTVVRTPSWSANAQARTLGILVIPNSIFEFSNFIFLNYFQTESARKWLCSVLIGNLILFRLVHPHWIGYLIDLIPSGLFVDCVSINSMPY